MWRFVFDCIVSHSLIDTLETAKCYINVFIYLSERGNSNHISFAWLALKIVSILRICVMCVCEPTHGRFQAPFERDKGEREIWFVCFALSALLVHCARYLIFLITFFNYQYRVSEPHILLCLNFQDFFVISIFPRASVLYKNAKLSIF